MQNVSATYSRLMNGTCRFETRLVIDGVGTFDEDQLFSVRTNIALFSGSPDVGQAVSQEIDVSMLQPSVTIPRMGCLRLYVRATGTAPKSSAVTITNETLSSQYASRSGEKITFAAGANATVDNEVLSFPVDATEELTSEWLPQGVFYIDTRSVTANYNGVPTLNLHGYDAMLKAEQEYSSNDVVGDAPDTQYVQAIADAIGVEVDPRTWDIMQGYIIPFPLGYTMREVLGYIATAYVGCWVMTEDGKLRLVSLLTLPEDPTIMLLSTEDREVITFGGNAILV